MAQHTPGPWQIVDRWKIVGDDMVLANMSGPRQGANARLIAAAPKMLEALQAVMGEWREGYGLNCVEQVRAAIAKATGE